MLSVLGREDSFFFSVQNFLSYSFLAGQFFLGGQSFLAYQSLLRGSSGLLESKWILRGSFLAGKCLSSWFLLTPKELTVKIDLVLKRWEEMWLSAILGERRVPAAESFSRLLLLLVLNSLSCMSLSAESLFFLKLNLMRELELLRLVLLLLEISSYFSRTQLLSLPLGLSFSFSPAGLFRVEIQDSVERSLSMALSQCCRCSRSRREWFLFSSSTRFRSFSRLASVRRQYFFEYGLQSEIYSRKWLSAIGFCEFCSSPCESTELEQLQLQMSFSFLQTRSRFLSCHRAQASSMGRIKMRGQSWWQKQYSLKVNILLSNSLAWYQRFKFSSRSIKYSTSSQKMLMLLLRSLTIWLIKLGQKQTCEAEYLANRRF